MRTTSSVASNFKPIWTKGAENARSLPDAIQQRIQSRLDQLGRTLQTFPHYRMQGADTFRLRVGDFRVIYQFNLERNELFLVSVGHRATSIRRLLIDEIMEQFSVQFHYFRA